MIDEQNPRCKKGKCKMVWLPDAPSVCAKCGLPALDLMKALEDSLKKTT